MTTLTFDTHQFVKSLVASGINEEQAEALVNELSAVKLENVATKIDVNDVRQEINDFRNEALREFDSVRNEMQLMEQRLTSRLGGIMVTGLVVLTAIVTVLQLAI